MNNPNEAKLSNTPIYEDIVYESPTEEFLQLYRRLEFEGRVNFFPDAKESDNIIGRLINTTQLKKFKGELDYCRVVRNFLVHNPRVNGVYPIEPSREMIELLKKCIITINNPPTVIDCAIKSEDLYTACLDDRIIEVLDMMNRFIYTYVPIIEDKRLIGVISHNSFFTHICKKKTITIEEDTLIRELFEYMQLDEHLNEYFSFVSRNTVLNEIEKAFKYNYKTRKRKLIGAMFITENGKREEEILGMITPWDILDD